MSKIPLFSAVVVAAAAINEEYRLARQSATDAIQHAILCGELLAIKKKELPHGEFTPWVSANCEFEYSAAARYMKAAKQSSTGVEFSTLSALFPSGRKKLEAPASPIVKIPVESGMVTVGTIDGDPVIILFESRLGDPGYWYDINVRNGNQSTRPCKVVIWEYLQKGNADAARFFSRISWHSYPDDGELARDEAEWTYRWDRPPAWNPARSDHAYSCEAATAE